MATSADNVEEEDFYYGQQETNNYVVPPIQRSGKNNVLPMWKNTDTMNLNHLILENIRISPYFKNKLSTFTTHHEVIDEIYYNVSHLEPWERGTHKTAGQTGMCGGVRGVGAGGVVSTPFCILFKLFTMKLTRKQLVGMINHTDSPYIRALGFMYIRFCQPPETFWEWLEPYFEDEEEIDPKAGGGDAMIMGQFVKLLLTKLDWYGTLFPRIPVPIQKDIDEKLREYNQRMYEESKQEREAQEAGQQAEVASTQAEARRSPRNYNSRVRDRSHERTDSRRRSRSRSRQSRSRHSRHGSSSRSHRRDDRKRSKSPRSSKDIDTDRRSSRKKDRSRSKSPSSKRRRSDSKHGHKKHKHRHHHRHRRHHHHRDRSDHKKSREAEEKDRTVVPRSRSGSESPSNTKAADNGFNKRDIKKSPLVEHAESRSSSTSVREKDRDHYRAGKSVADEPAEEGELIDDGLSEKEEQKD